MPLLPVWVGLQSPSCHLLSAPKLVTYGDSQWAVPGSGAQGACSRTGAHSHKFPPMDLTVCAHLPPSPLQPGFSGGCRPRPSPAASAPLRSPLGPGKICVAVPRNSPTAGGAKPAPAGGRRRRWQGFQRTELGGRGRGGRRRACSAWHSQERAQELLRPGGGPCKNAWKSGSDVRAVYPEIPPVHFSGP